MNWLLGVIAVLLLLIGLEAGRIYQSVEAIRILILTIGLPLLTPEQQAEALQQLKKYAK